MTVQEKTATTAADTTTTTTTTTPAEGATTPAPDSSGLNAGFSKVRGKQEPTAAEPVKTQAAEDTTTSTEAEKAAETTTTTTEAAKPAEEKVVVAGLTEQQLKDQLAKADQVNETLRKEIASSEQRAMGKIGELVRLVNDLKKSPTTAASGQPMKVAKEALKRLNADGYEELADALAEDLSALLTAAPGSQVDAEALEKSISEKYEARMLEARKETEKKLLTIRHKDWRTQWKSAEFQEWRKTLDAEQLAKVDHSWDSDVLGDAIDEFKTWTAAKAKKVADDAKKAADAEKAAKERERKNKRIEASVTPAGGGDTGGNSTVLPDKAGLGAGFNKVRPARRP